MKTDSNLRAFIIAIVAVISLFTMTASSAHAKASKENEQLWKVMTYQELMRLPTKARAKYLLGLREAVMEFEKNQRANGDAFARSQRESAQFLMWKALIAEAEASPTDATCPMSLQNTRAMRDAQQKHMGTFICLPPSMKSCPVVKGGYGFHYVGKFQGRAVCYEPSNEYIQKRRAERLAQLAKEKAAKAKAAAAKKAELKQRAAAAAEKSKPKHHAPAKPRAVASGHSSATDAAGSDNGEAGDSPSSKSTANEAKEDKDPETGSAESPDVAVNAATIAIVAADKDNDYEAREGHYVQLSDRTDALQTAQNGSACGPPPPVDKATCNIPKIREARRKNYADADAPHCMMAGNLSHYRDQAKRPGNCIAPNEFCFNKLTCRLPSRAMRTGAYVNYHCDNPKQVICNPYLFNVQLDDQGEGKAICVDHTGDEVSDCDKKAKKLESTTGATSVIQRARDDISVIDGWNEFAGELNEMCFAEPMATAYCSECQILKTRAWELRLVAEGQEKNKDKPDCYKLIKLIRPAGATVVPASTSAPSAQ